MCRRSPLDPTARSHHGDARTPEQKQAPDDAEYDQND